MSDQPQRKIDLKGQGFADRFKATPLAVVGAVGTCGVLGYGLYSFIGSSNGMSSARGMSLRVYGQAATLIGIVGLFAWSGKGPFEPIHKKFAEWTGTAVKPENH